MPPAYRERNRTEALSNVCYREMFDRPRLTDRPRFTERLRGAGCCASAQMRLRRSAVPRNSGARLLFVCYGRLSAMEVEMSRMWRRFRVVVATALALAVGSIPACGTMGGGGMKYFSEPPSEALNSIATERAVA